jgi:integrin alpha 8
LLKNWEKRNPKKNLMAVLGPKNTRKRDSLTIKKNCGSDNVCIPDLIINVIKNVDKYLLGSGKILELEVTIHNNGEDAYETLFYLQLPVGIDYINIENQNKSTELIIQCTAPKSSNNNTLRCDIGNPLPEGKFVKFKVFLQPIIFYNMKSTYELWMKVNSSNVEKPDTFSNNIYNISLPIWIETDLSIEGESKPQEIDFNSIDFINNDPTLSTNIYEFGPIVTHNYTIRNNGPSTILHMATSLIWAAETYSGDILLYLIEQPEVSNDKIHCDSANANYLGFKVSILNIFSY